ncbi:MAG: bifunctional (p)ppGpp synthetase/guanosine-3',5'-bis(diphosphate) 3'-pyrophosphohydrolase [Clostridiales bacterium]|nr:bifunctional (p)ppGpp synthetase/guanosine-3',5'-bis(diphosphate) 3'-pyrophosphohydrolase [Clostridiales bacterium]
MPEGVSEEILDLLDEVITKYKSYTGKDATDNEAAEKGAERIRRAFAFAYRAHSSQKRKTGEPYIIHPIATAQILTELEVDTDTLVAALLHDTVEDTPVTVELLQEIFGEDVALLVDGVTKLGRIPYSSKEEQQAENMRKMFLAMAKDIRVILIKLADRLHNMRTMKHQDPAKQREKALETRDIYAPLAHRLGIYKIKWELEDLCLRYTDPDAYYELCGAISQKRSEREKFLEKVVGEMQDRIKEMGITAEIEGRPKHFYSIYNKMKQQGKDLDQIYDIFACRIIVNTVSDCYAVLGLVHDMYYPMPGRFKDYIAMPKPNMYQSLHTTVIGKEGIPFEVQIRTFSMHRTAEYGIAAHWKYKESGNSNAKMKNTALDNKLSWLRQILDWQGESKDAGEYLDSLKTGLVAEEVFVFTPKGDVISLPLHSCPIDFAYAIHSGIGNRMYGAKVNGRLVPLSYELQNGDIVDILTSDQIKGPSRDWLKMVKTSQAKSKINAWFKKESRDDNILLGRETVEREIKKIGFTPRQLLQKDYVDAILKKTAQNTLDDLYAAIGYGVITAQKVVGRLRDEYIRSLPEDERFELGYRVTSAGQVVYQPISREILDEKNITAGPALVASSQEQSHTGKRQSSKAHQDTGVVVTGIENCLVHLSRCCNPVPGDEIIGYITRGNGVGVHRKDCSNIRNIMRNATASTRAAERASRLIEVYWNDQKHTKAIYPVEFTVIAHDRRHLLADISNAIAEERIPITSAQMSAMKDITARFTMTIEVKDQEQLDRVLGRIKAIRDVIEVRKGN